MTWPSDRASIGPSSEERGQLSEALLGLVAEPDLPATRGRRICSGLNQAPRSEGRSALVLNVYRSPYFRPVIELSLIHI